MQTPKFLRKLLSVLPSLVLATIFVLFARWFVYFGGSKANSTFSFVGSTYRPKAPAPPIPPAQGPPVDSGGSEPGAASEDLASKRPAAVPAESVSPTRGPNDPAGAAP